MHHTGGQSGSAVIYHGIFFTYEDVMELAERLYPGQRLAKDIVEPHVTFGFHKEMPEAFVRDLGRVCEARITGYANDGRNEGFRIVLSDALMAMYHGAAVPHITISIAEDARAVDTGALPFCPIGGAAATGLTLRGRLGYYGRDQAVHYEIEE